MAKNMTSRDFDIRDRERESGYTPSLLDNPLVYRRGYYVGKWVIYIVLSDGCMVSMTDEEEELWARDRLNLPELTRHGGRWIEVSEAGVKTEAEANS